MLKRYEMNHYLERLARIVLSDPDLGLERAISEAGQLVLVITDPLFANNQYIAEYKAPWHINMYFKVTPPLIDTLESVRLEIYDYILEAADRHGLSIPIESDTKVLGVGKVFSCMPGGTITQRSHQERDINYTLLNDSFQDAREALVSFYRCELEAIMRKLQEKGIRPF